ncbi:MAG: hypothetical protein JOY66_06865 [Acetobacteraceae bacterium]|nr:hypothetical protein [Acetobacteraceae bacterium]
MQSTLKRIALAAALSAPGGGAALAQGMPPGGPWQSSWPAYVEAQRAQAMNARGATTPRPEGRAAATRSGGPAPVASNALGRRRGS